MWYLSFFFALLMLSFEALALSITVEIDGSNNVESNSKLDKVREIVESVREMPNKCEPKAKLDFSKSAERLSELKCMEYVNELVQRQRNETLGCSDEKEISINHGKKAKAAEFPHMGALGWKVKRSPEPIFLCSATLISKRFLLTAAHCVYNPYNRTDLVSPEPYLVKLGSRYIKKSPAESPKSIPIEKIITYSEYESPMKYKDIALVKLIEDVKFSKFIMPACLYANEEFNMQFSYVASGWGFDIDNARTNYELQYTSVVILDNKICNDHLKWYKDWQGMQPHQTCALQLYRGTGVCTGDSGGPIQYLLLKTTSEGLIHRIVAVASFGLTECSNQYTPWIYTRVSSFLSWIEYNVWSEE